MFPGTPNSQSGENIKTSLIICPATARPRSSPSHDMASLMESSMQHVKWTGQTALGWISLCISFVSVLGVLIFRVILRKQHENFWKVNLNLAAARVFHIIQDSPRCQHIEWKCLQHIDPFPDLRSLKMMEVSFFDGDISARNCPQIASQFWGT